VLLWIDYVESTLQAIEIQDWIDELGKNKTVVAPFTGTELYFQHLLDLSWVQGVAHILKVEHIGDIPVHYLTGTICILPLQMGEKCLIDEVTGPELHDALR
jgi:hypothetical protein